MRRRQSSIWLLPAILQPLFIYFRFILLRFLVSLLFNSFDSIEVSIGSASISCFFASFDLLWDDFFASVHRIRIS
ncbi:Os10g0509700 [Oryza sativa Japonica Group]|uniref:Os10g0509700 protein n=1 Tax=Oryza sativa subsp. japonica TaxID=39947 RepID=A0A0P0XW27_ORYSJ|nr:Os10g0509700 [Oryza sativa Japonica Group]